MIIETRLQSTCDMYKEDLKHCLKRVSNILESGFYVNGNGEIENYISESIMQKLNCSCSKEEDQIYYNLTKEAFRNDLDKTGNPDCHIDDYNHFCKIYDMFNCKNMDDLQEIYVKSDVCGLADVIEY